MGHRREMRPDVSAPTCSVCERGREACEWCHDVDEGDFRAICDCGLHDFGAHMTDCASRAAYRFAVVANYASADLPRAPERAA